MNLDTIADSNLSIYYFKRNFRVLSINTAFVSKKKEKFEFSGERHNFWEMVYVEKGSLTVSEDERVYEMGKGQIIFHKPMEFHRFICKEDSTICVITFTLNDKDADFLGNGVFTLSADMRGIPFNIVEEINRYFDYDYRKWRIKKKEKYDHLGETKAVLKLELFLIDILMKLNPREEISYTKGAKHYRRIVSYLNDHLCDMLSVGDIAKGCNLSASNLKKVFREYTGAGVISYFNDLKIAAAMQLLKGEDSISEISDIMGFSSPGYFTYAFKRKTGMTPFQYRKKP